MGPGTEYFNIYPLFHTAAFYNGMRADMKQRALILARDAYLGAQHNGTIFWSSDISGNWDTLRRQVPTGINFVASGMPYWSTDIGGWQYLPAIHKPERPVLVDPSDARAEVGHYDDYPELYVRWFEYGAFQPNFRAHGSRPENEVWSYGKQMCIRDRPGGAGARVRRRDDRGWLCRASRARPACRRRSRGWSRATTWRRRSSGRRLPCLAVHGCLE